MALLLPLSAGADMPALTREFDTESYARDPGSLEALRATRGVVGSAAVLYLARADELGVADPDPGRATIGGRVMLAALVSRWTFGGDAVLDGKRQVEAREYNARFFVAAAVPEARLSARAVAGFEDQNYSGADLEVELAPVPIPLPIPDLDLRPELIGWVRARKPPSDDATLTPAVGLAIQHLPILASTLAFAVTATADLVEGERRALFGMAQARWTSAMAPALPDEDLPARPGVRTPAPPDRAFFAYGAYAFPFDSTGLARLAVGLGIRFRQLF
jgi:hypothetical protein